MRKILFALLVLGLIASSCGSKKKAARKRDAKKHRTVRVDPKHERKQDENTGKRDNKAKNGRFNPMTISSTEEYIEIFAPIAQDEMREFGIPASITLAQGILESGSGRGGLTLKTNNHFGIKCHRGWTGGTAYHDDDEKGECFRKYDHPMTSYRDHSLFLTSRSRYASLFDLREDDYEGWAKGLRKAGYATDRRYPQKLIALIERYHLYEYDEQVLSASGRKKRHQNKREKTHIVRRGDTLYSISKRYNTTVESLKRTNRLRSNTIAVGQELKIR
ncbi:glucosaminidase domain-containing protein [Sinomicrobium weinanense]|uniref:Peptidoglycan hydrolase n=1 Tax=Sinomicrobium weinanense TaxID=2842200 RepID=A0A926JV37_9FLAO|nr:glucosaminidase domain-containing protein [Sinomicrobium weinanense]MBC9797914.1 glucosaminidase domain-containing protein [Sinomicrobium weinanense]MBU3123199.1 glucosaminidase domain-containing protein [Sinomicrobium weinanense]